MPSSSEELGNIIGSNIRATEDQNQSMSHSSGEDSNIIFITETIPVKVINLVITTHAIGTAFILGHPTNGVLGATGMGLGAGTYDATGTEVVRRLWRWNNETELEKGTEDSVITLEYGDIRFKL